MGDQEAGGGQALPTSAVQELAQSGDRPQSSARTMQRSVTRVRAPPIALVLMETGPGPPLRTAEHGKQGGPVQLGDGPASISEDSVPPRLPNTANATSPSQPAAPAIELPLIPVVIANVITAVLIVTATSTATIRAKSGTSGSSVARCGTRYHLPKEESA